MRDRFLTALHVSLDSIGTLFGLAIGGIAVCMAMDITVRALGLGGFPWLVELTEYLLYAGSFLAAPWLLRHDGHVRVDVIAHAFAGPAGARFHRTIDAVGAAISGCLAWYGSVAVVDAWRTGAMQYKTWTVPEWLLLSPIPIACLLLLLEFAVRVLGFEHADESRDERAERGY